MTRWKWTAAVLCCALLGGTENSFAGPVPPPIIINPNYDLVVTKQATLDFGGSLGVQQFVGVPLGNFDFGPPLGVVNVGVTDTILRRTAGGTLNTATDSFTTPLEVIAICLKSQQQLDLGYGSDYYYATLGSAPTSGTMTINGDGTWTNSFSFGVDLHRGSKTGPTDVGGIPFSLAGLGEWSRLPGPHYRELIQRITVDPENDGEFFLLGNAVHTAPDKEHIVVDISRIPEPSTGLLLLAGGLAVVWRTRRSRVAA
jgi:hypothetical protein